MNDQVRPIAPDTTNPGGDGIEVTTNEARGGSTPHMTRYILAGSLILVVVAFLIILGIGGFNG